MDKLQMAHEFMMKKMETETIDNHWELFYSSWRYADAMQAEADKRVNKERPEALCEVDWGVAPSNAEFYLMRCGEAVWSNGFSTICPAPTFGFTGSHIVERPHGF